MKILFIGDIFGSLGRDIIKEQLPKIREKYKPHIIIANGENIAHGKGINEKYYKFLLENGVNAVTLGNHTWDNRSIFDFIDSADYLVRPGNFPESNPGKGLTFLKFNSYEVAVISLQGRTFLPMNNCPFITADALIEEAKKRTNIIVVDFHAEASSEKIALGYYLDGRVSAVLGTHTHVPTADERVLAKGCAYITDVGMTGPLDGVIGVEKDNVIQKFIEGLPIRFNAVESGSSQLNAVLFEVNEKTGKSSSITRINLKKENSF
ncbi:MAG TPA: TIGR00282 family metallophosphoesterase [Firmicutes bacterium]|nr:TIGR00282 family metallophosphoesterase [Bacillota bacterium]